MLITETFCNMINRLEEVCFENSILEIWNYNANTIENLTDDEILRVINLVDVSHTTRLKYSDLLGKVILSACLLLYRLAVAEEAGFYISLSLSLSR